MSKLLCAWSSLVLTRVRGSTDQSFASDATVRQIFDSILYTQRKCTARSPRCAKEAEFRNIYLIYSSRFAFHMRCGCPFFVAVIYNYMCHRILRKKCKRIWTPSLKRSLFYSKLSVNARSTDSDFIVYIARSKVSSLKNTRDTVNSSKNIKFLFYTGNFIQFEINDDFNQYVFSVFFRARLLLNASNYLILFSRESVVQTRKYVLTNIPHVPRE